MTPLLRSAVLAALLASCATWAAAAPSKASVASVNGVAIPESELDRALQTATRGGAADTPQLRAALKSQLIAREVFRQAAEKQGLAKKPDVEARVRDARASILMQAYLDTNLKPKAISDAEVKARYDQIVASLGPTEYKPRVIETASEDEARKALAELKQGTAFDSLARKYGKGPLAANGGAMNWVSFKALQEGQTQGIPLPLAQVIATLKPGMVGADPVKLANGWVVAKLDEARPTQIPAFDTVAPQLRKTLEFEAHTQALEALTVGLIKAAKIQQ